MKLTPEQLSELISEAERECPIDFGYLSIDENAARLLIASQLIELYSSLPSEHREIAILSALGHQILQNEILNLNLIEVIKNNSKVDLLPCPLCGHDMTEQYEITPDETIYRLNDYHYQLVCQEYAGGCGLYLLADSFEDCIRKWNKRHEK